MRADATRMLGSYRPEEQQPRTISMRKLIAVAAALGFLTATSLPVFAQDKPAAPQTEQSASKPAAPAKTKMKKSKKSMKKSMKKSSKKMSKSKKTSKAKAKKPAPKMDDQKKS